MRLILFAKKKMFFLLLLAAMSFSLKAQKVSNIRAEQRGQDIVILYSLETTSPCEVVLTLSQDNGSTWSAPLKNVSGDVGNNITSGEKQIIWEVLEEQDQLVGKEIRFKVMAIGKSFVEPEMILVKSGNFQMGSNRNQNEMPIHKVSLNSFYISKFEVNQALWEEIMGSNPSKFNTCMQCPVEMVSWMDVQNFLMEIYYRTGKKYRLPTEAEWEYAAQGGERGGNYIYSGSNNIQDVAWFYYNSNSTTHRSGGKAANVMRVFDLTGNVWEWCSDWYGEYPNAQLKDPKGPVSGTQRVVRGGGWDNEDFESTITTRYRYEIDTKSDNLGFRLVLPIE
jgi:sulfatase modifying factor 1